MKTTKALFGILSITAALVVQVQAQTFLTNGLVAYYPFNGNANDASGNGNDATPSGSYQFLANGLSGGALRIIGDNSLYYSGGGYVQLPTFGSNMNSGFTLSLWTKDEVIGGYPVNEEAYWSFGAEGASNLEIMLDSGLNSIRFSMDTRANGQGSYVDLFQPFDFQSDPPAWKHIVLAYEPGRLAVFFKGQKVAQTNVTLNLFPVSLAALNRHWWSGGAASSARMSVTYDNVRIYNRALSDSEVAQLYAYESVPPPSFLTNGLVAYYPFNGNANDESGNGNNASFIGTNYVFASDPACTITNGTYIDAGNIFPPTQDAFTESCWIKSIQQQQPIGNGYLKHIVFMTRRTGTNYSGGWATLCINDEGYLSLTVDDDIYGNECQNTNYTASSVFDGTWHHVVGVKSNTLYSLCFDGQAIATITDSHVLSASDGTRDFWIGRHAWNYVVPLESSDLDASLRDVRIYSRALSSDEVAALYAYEFQATKPPLSSSLVLDLPLDGSAVDVGPYNFTVITNGGGTWVPDRFLQANSALSLNGVNQNIVIPYDARLFPDEFTLSAWFNFQQLLTIKEMALWRAGNASSDAWRGFGMTTGLNCAYRDFTGSGNNAFLSMPSTNFIVGEWYQIVVTRTTNSVALFVNGVEVASQTGLTPYAKPQVTPISFGANNGDPSGFYEFCQMTLDTVHIYNRALSSDEVAQLYAYESQATNPPSITGQPQSLVVNAHDAASFSVTASGTEPLVFQWSLNGTNILGATSSSLTISNVVQRNLGAYAVVVTNEFGSVTSSNAMLSMYPFIAVPFAGAITYWGKDAALSVGAWGTGPLSYQWFKDGVALQNATNQVLNLTSIQFTNAGLYWVVVSSPLGSVTNKPAQVVVEPAGVSLGLYPGVTVSGVVGYTYIIQATSDLTSTNSWVTVAELTLMQPIQLWVDINSNVSSPTNTHRFYRVLPGP